MARWRFKSEADMHGTQRAPPRTTNFTHDQRTGDGGRAADEAPELRKLRLGADVASKLWGPGEKGGRGHM